MPAGIRARLVAMALSLLLPAGAWAQVAPHVTIDTGTLAGSVENGVASWKGIPFAAPPVGPLRWRAPQPPAPWAGVRQATDFGHDCMQVPFRSDFTPLGNRPAEDCLYANVWRPAASTQALPVIVWIYGGGFVNGGAAAPVYSGANLARQGVMVVSFNYRLGRFGTFVHPQLSRENADGGLLGNYGYMDQLALLGWVRRNIAAFGGDPANVTIAGESAGGMSVHMLVTSPLARGLFARAAMMSADTGRVIGSKDQATVERIGIDFAAGKSIPSDDPNALARLRALTAAEVTDGLSMMTLLGGGGRPRTFASPFPDGRIAVDAQAAYEAGNFEHVPMMIGATDADLGGRNGVMVVGARRTSRTIAATDTPVYAYRFAYVAEWIGQADAQHASDIPYFLDTTLIHDPDRATPRDIEMGRIMSGYLVNFARTGNPNGGGLPAWPRYAPDQDEIMIFDRDGAASAQRDPWAAELDAVVGEAPVR